MTTFDDACASASSSTITDLVVASGRDVTDVLASWADDGAQPQRWAGATATDIEPAWSAPPRVTTGGLAAVRAWVAAGRPVPCCWQDCHRPATDVDSDGDVACALHAAQSERYVEVTDLSGEAWLDEASAERAEALLSAAGWDIEIRSPRRCEIQATYLVTSGGLQYLGGSIPVPEPLRQALREAAEKALEGA
jgi:hypothetical protein